jgi:hypothetical protein
MRTLDWRAVGATRSLLIRPCLIARQAAGQMRPAARLKEERCYRVFVPYPYSRLDNRLCGSDQQTKEQALTERVAAKADHTRAAMFQRSSGGGILGTRLSRTSASGRGNTRLTLRCSRHRPNQGGNDPDFGHPVGLVLSRVVPLLVATNRRLKENR